MDPDKRESMWDLIPFCNVHMSVVTFSRLFAIKGFRGHEYSVLNDGTSN